MKKHYLFILALSVGLSVSASAAIKMQPGLWEHSFVMKSQSGKAEKAMDDMKKQLANMSKEQRKMIEDMMAKQGLGMNAKENTLKVCISKEQAEKLEFPQGQTRHCSQEITERTSTTVKMKFNCTGNPKATGESEFVLTGDKAYTGKTFMNTELEGKPDRLDIDQKGKWISADCGNIKSLSDKK